MTAELANGVMRNGPRNGTSIPRLGPRGLRSSGSVTRTRPALSGANLNGHDLSWRRRKENEPTGENPRRSELLGLLDGAQLAVVADYAGLTVPTMVEFRAELRKSSQGLSGREEHAREDGHEGDRSQRASPAPQGPGRRRVHQGRIPRRRRRRHRVRQDQPEFKIRGACSAAGPSSTRRASKPSRSFLARTSCGRCCSAPSWAFRQARQCLRGRPAWASCVCWPRGKSAAREAHSLRRALNARSFFNECQRGPEMPASENSKDGRCLTIDQVKAFLGNSPSSSSRSS
jgi:hypothetical protein